MSTDPQTELKIQRMSLLRRLESTMERPLALLGFVWLALLATEFTRGLGPFLSGLTNVIWGVFVFDFLVKLVLAPDKSRFLSRNVLTLISLVIPALRIFRVVRIAPALRAFRAARGLRLLRLVTSVNRGMRALSRTLRRRGLGYALVLTLLVLVAGASGMYAFESDPTSGAGFEDFGSALWWTAMILVSMGSDYWPVSAEGRLLCLVLAVYGFSIFGYFTAALSSYFVSADIGPDRKTDQART